MRSIAEIDTLLAQEKWLFGAPEWVEEGRIAKLASVIVDDQGVVLGGLSLRLSAQVETSIQRGNAVFVIDNVPVQRLSFLPDHVHVNGNEFPIPAGLRFKRLPEGRSRIYRWSDNRCWPTQGKAPAGEMLPEEPASLDEAFKLFLETCAISAYLPDAPHRPRLEL